MAESDPKRITPARLVGGGWRSGRRDSAVFAVAGTILVHLLALLLAPAYFGESSVNERRAERPFEVVLEEPEEFVFTNPDAPSNPPDETEFFSSRDQQAAQEQPSDEGDPSLPEVEGEEPEPTQNIVPGETVPPVPEEEVFAESGDAGESGADFGALPERLIPGFEPVEEDEGLEVPVTEEPAPDLEEDPVIGVEIGTDDRSGEHDDSGESQEQPVQPRPRPTLPQVSRGPVGERQGAAPRVGQVAVDANFSEYGDYLARMLDVIVRQWHSLAWESLPSGEVGTVVAVSFQVTSEGRIQNLEVVNSTAGLIATLICQDAVESRQPYGEWTPDMIDVLGEKQTVRIRFLYR